MIEIVTDWVKLKSGYEDNRMSNINHFKLNHTLLLDLDETINMLGLTDNDVRAKLKIKLYLLDKVYIPKRVRLFK